MAQGFYELLGVDPNCDPDSLRAAYQRRLAELVRRLRSARRQGADVSILESQERRLREAMDILSEPGRRRRYDAFRLASTRGLPSDAEALWDQARASLVDPIASVALATVRALTDLPVGDPLPEPTQGYGVRRPDAESPAELPPAPDLASLSAQSRPTDPAVASFAAAPLPTPEIDLDLGAQIVPFAPPPTEPPPDSAPAPLDDVDQIAREYGFDGRFLQAVRELRGLPREDLARSTRISTRYLQAIEENGFDRLPAATFVRGYIKQIADVLDISGRGVVEGFMDLYVHHRG